MQRGWINGRVGMGSSVGGMRLFGCFVTAPRRWAGGGRGAGARAWEGQTWRVSEVAWGIRKLMMIVEGAREGGRDPSARFPWGGR